MHLASLPPTACSSLLVAHHRDSVLHRIEDVAALFWSNWTTLRLMSACRASLVYASLRALRSLSRPPLSSVRAAWKCRSRVSEWRHRHRRYLVEHSLRAT
jgi:hypothetical protein